MTNEAMTDANVSQQSRRRTQPQQQGEERREQSAWGWLVPLGLVALGVALYFAHVFFGQRIVLR